MNTFGKVREVSNDGSDWMFPQFKSIKETNVAFTMNKMLQVCIGKVGGFKMSDAVGTSIHRVSADNMFMNPTVGVFSDITCSGWNL